MHVTMKISLRTSALAAGAILSGCATLPVVPIASAPPPPPPVAGPRPMPPAGASASQAIPPLRPDGGYRTINSGLSPAATIWHVRSALNVAALGCRDQEAAIVTGYNALLASKKTLLKAAFAQTETEARKAGGTDWRDTHDREMTQTYNFFAQPPAKAQFCAVAAEVAAEAATVPAQQFQAYAGAALARLEAPFLAFYRDYGAYRLALAAWEAGSSALAAGDTVPPPAPSASATPTATSVTLSYAPIDSVIGWSPAAQRADRRLASAELRRSRP